MIVFVVQGITAEGRESLLDIFDAREKAEKFVDLERDSSVKFEEYVIHAVEVK